MKVRNNINKMSTIKFKELSVSDTFLFKGELYMKTNHMKQYEMNAFGLHRRLEVNFQEKTEVIKVDCTVTINNYSKD